MELWEELQVSKAKKKLELTTCSKPRNNHCQIFCYSLPIYLCEIDTFLSNKSILYTLAL